MVMTGDVFTSWPSTLVFFRLMVSPKSLQAWFDLSIRHCRSCSVCEVTVASSAKSMSLMMVTHTLVFALSLVMFYSLPSDLLCMCTQSVEFLKVCFRRREKRMLKRIGARTQPSFTPLMIRGLPSYHHEKIWSCCEASEDIRALGGCWRAYSRLPGKRPRSDPWRQCRGAFAVPCSSTIVGEGAKSCPL